MKTAESVLLTRQQLATKYLCCDVKTIDRMADDGRIPAPVDLGRDGGSRRMRRWRKSDIEEWLQDGCPRRDTDGDGEAE